MGSLKTKTQGLVTNIQKNMDEIVEKVTTFSTTM